MSIGDAVGLGRRVVLALVEGGTAAVTLLVFSLYCLVACGDAPDERQLVQLSVVEQKLTSQDWPSDPLVVTNSVQIDHRALFEGNVAVTNPAGSVLAHGAEVALEFDSQITGAVRADTLYLANGSKIVGNTTYNAKFGVGTVQGTATTPLPVPLPITLPQLPTFSAGTQAITVATNQVQSLLGGSYGAITLSASNTGGTTKLNLQGGTYTFASIAVGPDARIECQAECEVRVNGRVVVEARGYFGPATVTGLGPGNVRLLVKGGNGGGSPNSTPSTCVFDNDSTLAAWTLVPNGTLRLGQRVQLRGKFVARDAIIGIDSSGKGLELPVVVEVPQDVTVWQHQTAVFSVTATGTGITYQWQKNGVSIPGATSPTLTITDPILADNATQFSVVLSNEAGSVTSTAATLTVIPALTPQVTCVDSTTPLPNGGVLPGRVVFGYENPRGEPMEIPVGSRNQLRVSDAAPAAPITTFAGTGTMYAFIAPLPEGGSATWTLDGVSVTANEASPACPQPNGVPSLAQRPTHGDAPGDYDPNLPDVEPYAFDGLQAYYSSDFRIPTGWRQQLGSLDLQELQPPPGTPVVLPVGLGLRMEFENFSWLDDGGERDHLRVLISVNGAERGQVDCPRNIRCSEQVDLGMVLPGQFDPNDRNLAGLELTVQFRRCPLFEDCYWRTIGTATSIVTLDLGRTWSSDASSGYCDEHSCAFFIGSATDIGWTRIRFEDYDGVNDVFNIDWLNEVTPPNPPAPEPPLVSGTPGGLCVTWNTSFVEDLLYLNDPPKYPAAFAEFHLVVKNVTGDVFELGRLDSSSLAAPAFLNEHGCIPYVDAEGEPAPLFDALVSPAGSELPTIEMRVATRFRRPVGNGATTFDVHRLNSYVSLEDADVKEALATLDGSGPQSNLVLLFRTDGETGSIDRSGFHVEGGFQVPPSPWVLGAESNSTLHPMTNTAAVVSQTLRIAGPTQFAPGTAHYAEVGPGCPGGTDQSDRVRTTACVSDGDCTDPALPRCLDYQGSTNTGRACGCSAHSQCSNGRTCALPALGSDFGQCAINQGDSCAVGDPITGQDKLFIGPPVLQLNATSCSTTEPCPGHELCLRRTPERRYPELMANPDEALSYMDLNPLVVRLDPCTDGATNCMCHSPDQGRWKFVVAHEAGHHVQNIAGASLGSGDYLFDCPPNSTVQTCPALDTQERYLAGHLYDPPFVPPACGCSHVTEANKWHCLQSLERTPAALGEGFAQFFAAMVFNDATVVAPPTVDPCTFVYYKSYKDAAGTVHPAPYPISCAAEDRWRNNHCPIDGDLATEQDWMQFLWAWHTVALNNDVGNMYTIFKAACQCWLDPGTGNFGCTPPPGCTYNAGTGTMECGPDANCQPGSSTCEVPACINKAAYWDWPEADKQEGKTTSLREGVIWRYSGGLNSTQTEPNEYAGYTQFEALSVLHGVSRSMELK